MKQFIVSALKYRPKSFEEVIGQDNVTYTLKNSLITNQIPQALIFSGPRGVGKTSCARILAKEINNLESNNSEDYTFNIFELDAASNNSVEDIRKINEQVRIPPRIGKYKVYIIDEVHMLSNSAFNAFLKTLEEPPKHIIFILATTEKNKIIPTVLSRCQIYDFNRISVVDIQSYLKKIAVKSKFKFEENALFLIAQKADGSLRDALSIYDRMVSFTKADLNEKSVADNLNLIDNKTYCSLGKIIFSNNIPQLIKSYDKLKKRGIEDAQFINGLANFFRNLILAKDFKTLHLLEVGEELKLEYAEISKKLLLTKILESIELINKSEINFRNVRNKRVHLELTLMRLASIEYGSEKKNDQSSSNYKSPISKANNNLELSSEVQERKDILNDASNDFIKTEKNKSSNINLKKNEVKETKIETSNTNRFDKNENHSKISSYSLSSIEVKKSLKDIKKNKNEVHDLAEEKFKLEDLKVVIQEYIEQLKKEGKLNLTSILSMNPVKLDNNNVIFTVANELNRVEINLEKEKLLSFICNKLNNFKIAVQVNISEIKKEKIIFTQKEKYQHLLEINPSVETLRKKFDLEY
tara:strand:- start:9544 stop:11292 length:1749 start_codon:yes stop_codon:yes gene_type:complete